MATIGELTNVPQPGSAVQSAWAQDVSGRVLHRFANFAALNAWDAPAGAHAVTLDDGMIWLATAAALPNKWSHRLPRAYWTVGVSLTVVGGLTRPTARVTIPADPSPRFAVINYVCFTSNPAAVPGFFTLWANAVAIANFGLTAPTGGAGIMIDIDTTISLAANTAYTIDAEKPATSWTTDADLKHHALYATVIPGTITQQTTPVPP